MSTINVRRRCLERGHVFHDHPRLAVSVLNRLTKGPVRGSAGSSLPYPHRHRHDPALEIPFVIYCRRLRCDEAIPSNRLAPGTWQAFRRYIDQWNRREIRLWSPP